MSTELEYLTLDARVEHALAGIGIAEGEGTINSELVKDVRACITKLHDALNLAELHNELFEQEHPRTGEAAARRIMGDA